MLGGDSMLINIFYVILLLFLALLCVLIVNYLRSTIFKKVTFICDDPHLYPYKKHFTDAGWDIKAAESTVILPREYKMISTSLKVAIPDGYYGHILPRSSLALTHGIMTMAGVIDSEYRDEVKVLLYNASDKPFKIEVGDRIAQLVVIKILLESELISVLEAEECGIMDTQRGTNGFGSTGK